VDKYGTRVSGMLEGIGGRLPSFVSRWWRDLMTLEDEGGVRWFNRELVRK